MPRTLRRFIDVLADPMSIGLVGVALLAAAYPVVAEQTQQPLAIFVLPVLACAALGSWKRTIIVAAAASSIAAVEGIAQDDLDTTALLARMLVILTGSGVGVVVARERHRRQRLIDESAERGVLLAAFQEFLVPVPIPPPGVIVHSRYIPGDARLELGGDFFDAIHLPNGHLGYVIGDVCGHGPRAAAFGATIRSGWKTLATETPDDPLRWVNGLDTTFFRLGRHSDTFVTLNTGTIELGNPSRLRYVSAGHCWPLIVTPDGAESLHPSVGPPLGVGVKGWAQSHATLATGSTLLLHTDGLIENRRPDGRRDLDGEERLITYLTQAATPINIEDLLRTFGPHGFDDDVALLSIEIETSRRPPRTEAIARLKGPREWPGDFQSRTGA